MFISVTKKKLSLDERGTIKGISIVRYEAITEEDLKEKQIFKPFEQFSILWTK
jgi:hypothetical protein